MRVPPDERLRPPVELAEPIARSRTPGALACLDARASPSAWNHSDRGMAGNVVGIYAISAHVAPGGGDEARVSAQALPIGRRIDRCLRPGRLALAPILAPGTGRLDQLRRKG